MPYRKNEDMKMFLAGDGLLYIKIHDYNRVP